MKRLQRLRFALQRRLNRLRWPRTPLSLAGAYPEYPVGKGSYGGLDVIRGFGPESGFSLGSWCSIGDGVKVFLNGGHHSEWVTTFPFTAFHPVPGFDEDVVTSRGPVHIGSDVWIGTEAMVLSGVTIGHGAIIGARAVVTRDVEPYAIVAGNPARTIRKRFDDETIARLLAVKWWEWPEQRVLAAAPLLMAADISRFLDLAEAGEI